FVGRHQLIEDNEPPLSEAAHSFSPYHQQRDSAVVADALSVNFGDDQAGMQHPLFFDGEQDALGAQKVAAGQDLKIAIHGAQLPDQEDFATCGRERDVSGDVAAADAGNDDALKIRGTRFDDDRLIGGGGDLSAADDVGNLCHRDRVS